MVKIKRRMLLFLITSVSLIYSIHVCGFVVHAIQVNGLQRIPRSTVLNYVPVKPGQELSDAQTSEVLQALYKTGFFSDVNLARQGNVLIINVVERAVIGAIRISGNKEIKTADLTAALKNSGIAEGLPYDSSIIEAMKRALLQQYNSQGRYDADVNVKVSNESDNRVGINIEIKEGKVSKIKEIHITGNKAFSERKLLKVLQSSRTRLWSFFTSNDQYVKEKLDSDLDLLRVYYMDRGYLKFKVNSSDAKMSPDKRKVIINIDINEGPLYHIQGVEVAGDKIADMKTINKLVLVKKGSVFSRKTVMLTRDLITRYLSNQGYALAEVNINPVIDDATHTVILKYTITTGKRVYVRRISFSGNVKTTDEVLRRELRQMEGALYSAGNVEESKRRLSNLGYLQNVQIRAVPIEESPNLVDLECQVAEMSSASANFQVGYSDAYGLLYGANLNQTNFLGTGRLVSASFQENSAATNVSFTYYNPYYTMSGIGRGFSVYSQYATPGRIGITPFRMNTYGFTMKYDIPVSEFSRVSLGFGYDNIRLFTSQASSLEIQDFVREHGKSFDQFKIAFGWSRSTYDRAVFPTCGWKQNLAAEIGLPFTSRSLDYYKIHYDMGYYHRLINCFIIHLRGLVGYGNGYARFDELPFFKNYYAGGIDSVRGYEDNTLGPRDSNFNPIGGNVITVGSASLIVPNPFPDQLRTSIFVDAGNVFNNHVTFKDNGIRTSAGVQFEWLSPMGPIHFSFSKALNPGRFDETRVFQFSLGASF